MALSLTSATRERHETWRERQLSDGVSLASLETEVTVRESNQLRINGERLWSTLMRQVRSALGALEVSGVYR